MQSSDSEQAQASLPAVVDESVATAVRRDLDKIAERDAALAASPLAMSALALARELDDPANSATSKSMCARALEQVWTRILSLTPRDEEGDEIDALKQQREERLDRRADAENLPRTEGRKPRRPGGN